MLIGTLVAHGALATGLGQTGIFGDVQVALGPAGIAGKRNFGDISVGPKGQVLVTYQSPTAGPGPSQVFVNLDANGTNPGYRYASRRRRLLNFGIAESKQVFEPSESQKTTVNTGQN